MRNRWANAAMVVAVLITIVVALRAHIDTRHLLSDERDRVDALRGLLTSTHYGLAIVDPRGQIVEWNPAMEDLTGWPAADAKAQGLAAIIGEQMLPRHQKAFDAAFARPEDSRKVQRVRCMLDHRDKCRPPIPIIVSVRVVTARSGKRFAVAHVDRERAIVERTSARYLSNHLTKEN
jgi:PAS domain S-box-containing protein